MRKDGWEDMDGRIGGSLSSLVVASTIVCFPIAHQVAMLLFVMRLFLLANIGSFHRLCTPFIACDLPRDFP